MTDNNEGITTTISRNESNLTIAILVIFIIIFSIGLGHWSGFNNALSGTFTDRAGRNCIAVEMYKPTQARADAGAQYGEWPTTNGRGVRIYCEDAEGDNDGT